MTITGIFRYPVKSMLGESLASCVLDADGVPGDRAYAVVDEESGAVASAKVPRRWGRLLEFSARYLTEPRSGAPAPPIEITFPDGAVRRSDAPDVDDALSADLGRSGWRPTRRRTPSSRRNGRSTRTSRRGSSSTRPRPASTTRPAR
jgi:hypothetical protein